ncbi:hypothetical protein HQ314_00140 [Rhodococcus sp. BP-332]|uniref:hypothetical protein n=1 Tax=Rhodococcus sp. BP-332 TaxID=2739447 RepID=UPI001C9B75B8|nr:hypothetical protein [Rhodococcus sp. BP-332]MBY6675324.1 hypothetical protein [Rhodococcus sp. BP-332]
MTERELSAEFDEIRRKIEANERAADNLFVPSPTIERLLWQVVGGCETVVQETRALLYVNERVPSVGPDFTTVDPVKLPSKIRAAARQVNMRLPSKEIWTPEWKRAIAMRHDLAHMLHIAATEGTTPEQAVTIVRTAYKAPDEMTTDPTGLTRHRRVTVTITEREARVALEGLAFIHRCIDGLHRFGIRFATWQDDRSIESVLHVLPWWLSDWGPHPGESGWTAPTMRQLRIRPKAEFDASLPPDMRPEF